MKSSIRDAIMQERERQDIKHPCHPIDFTFIAPAVLGEEVGEVHKAWLEGDHENLKVELIQVAAVAIRWLEMLI